LNPRSIAVFGGAPARELVRQNELMGYTGEIWPVHPSETEILGRKVYRSVAELPGCPDAAYVGVNRRLTVDIVRELAARGAGGAICYASGFAEAGAEGARLAAQLLEVSGDMPLIGPNCYGLLNYLEGAMLWPDQQGGRRVERGVAIITMSSNVGFNLTMQRRGLPIAYVLSLGNRLKFDLDEAIRLLAGQDRVTAIGLFLETMPDPHAFQEAIALARDLGKPVVAMKIGRTCDAQKMVVSHTASLAGSDELVSALFDLVGVARVNSLEAFIEALKVLHVLGPLPGGRIGAMSTSGGDLILLADALGPELSLPELTEPVAADLSSTLHERVIAANPLDYQMFSWNDEPSLTASFSAFLSAGFDVGLCLLDYPRDDRCDPCTWLGAERAFVRAAVQTGTRGAILATFTDTLAEPVADRLMQDGVALLAGIDDGLAGVRAAVTVGSAWRRPPPRALLARSAGHHERAVRVLDEAETKMLLAQAGVPVPASRTVRTADEAVEAARAIGFPVAVKALGLAHKTEVGGLRINLDSEQRLVQAIDEMRDLAPSFLVEEMITGVVAELLVGVARDEQFGPYLLVGDGGVLVEMKKDSAPILLPASRERVMQALGQLRCAALFSGFRGSAPADMDAAVDVILKIASLIEDAPDSIAELDINPLLLLAQGQGVFAADGLMCLYTGPRSDGVDWID
jgi:acyl-CoA synthetase (NDP forming)